MGNKAVYTAPLFLVTQKQNDHRQIDRQIDRQTDKETYDTVQAKGTFAAYPFFDIFLPRW